jgi:hypothetical protein
MKMHSMGFQHKPTYAIRKPSLTTKFNSDKMDNTWLQPKTYQTQRLQLKTHQNTWKRKGTRNKSRSHGLNPNQKRNKTHNRNYMEITHVQSKAIQNQWNTTTSTQTATKPMNICHNMLVSLLTQRATINFNISDDTYDRSSLYLSIRIWGTFET